MGIGKRYISNWKKLHKQRPGAAHWLVIGGFDQGTILALATTAQVTEVLKIGAGGEGRMEVVVWRGTYS